MRTAVQTSPNDSRKDTALSKAWILFANGAKQTWYSFDSSGRYNVEKNRDYGIRGLKKRVLEAWSPIDQAHIYDTQTGRKICELVDGQWLDVVPA